MTTDVIRHQLPATENAAESLKHERSASKTTEDSGFSDEERISLQSSDYDGQEYHFVQALKVLGVHKQEKPKVHYMFVIIVRWDDKSQITVYRKWSEIKEFQREVLKSLKGQKHLSETHHFIKKTAQRVKKVAKFRHGTIKKLDMIDSLNKFFEALVHYEITSHSAIMRRFFKPTNNDLNSLSWSGDGRTYFYVTPNDFGEKNGGYEGYDDEDEVEEDESVDESIDATKHINEEGTAIKQTQEEFNNALEKYNEADPSITWPIKSSIYVAMCDYDASKEDPKDNIVGLAKGEEVEVLEKNESGWWLVTRPDVKSKAKNGLSECGYVPASFLEIKARKVVPIPKNDSFESTTSLGIDDDEVSSFSFGSNISDEVMENENKRHSESSVESVTDEEKLSLQRRGRLLRSDTVESFGSMASIDDSDWTASPFTSMESVASSVDTPTPKPRRKKTIAFIERANQRPLSPLVFNQKCVTPTLGRHRLQSDISRMASPHGSMTPPVVKRAMTFDTAKSTSISDLTSIPFGSLSLSRSSSTQSLTKKGTDYAAIKCYRAVNDDELSFENGSILKVISRNANGWWTATYEGKTGFVPAVNLKRYRDPIRNMSMHMLDKL